MVVSVRAHSTAELHESVAGVNGYAPPITELDESVRVTQ